VSDGGPVAPTGEQWELRHGEQRAVVVKVGGGLRSYDVADRSIVDGYPADAKPDGGRGQVLAPWPNRIADGRYRWADVDQQLPLTEVAHRNAIHGLVRWAEWSLLDRDPAAVRVGVRVWPQPGYPFALSLTATYELDERGLRVLLEARNDGTAPAPYGVGQHPYVQAGTAVVDDVLLTVPADEWLRCDDRGLPVASEPVQGSPYDFRSGRRIGETVLDTPYAGLVADGDGRVVVRLAHPDDGTGVSVWGGEGTRCLQVFSGDTLTPARRRQGLAVEPMSCPPDAFRSGTDLVTLKPGAAHALEWGLHVW
jgi:galactose mutarotase-like enzyme